MGRSDSARLMLQAPKACVCHPGWLARVVTAHRTKEPVSSVRSKVNPSAARGVRIMTPHARDGFFSLGPYHKLSCLTRQKPHG